MAGNAPLVVAHTVPAPPAAHTARHRNHRCLSHDGPSRPVILVGGRARRAPAWSLFARSVCRSHRERQPRIRRSDGKVAGHDREGTWQCHTLCCRGRCLAVSFGWATARRTMAALDAETDAAMKWTGTPSTAGSKVARIVERREGRSAGPCSSVSQRRRTETAEKMRCYSSRKGERARVDTPSAVSSADTTTAACTLRTCTPVLEEKAGPKNTGNSGFVVGWTGWGGSGLW